MITRLSITVAALSALAAPALAAEHDAAGPAPFAGLAQTAAPAAPPAAASDNPFGAEPLSEAVLDEQRGKFTFVIGDQKLTAINMGNTINGDFYAGSVFIDGGAFSNFAGILNMTINTGAQANLQSGVNFVVNVDGSF